MAATDRRYRIKPADPVFILIGLLLTALSAWLVYSGPAPSTLVIQADNIEYRYSLDKDRHIELPGPLGNTIVEIRDGRARIVESPCKNKTCIAAGWVSLTGQWTACLPNTVFIRIEGEEDHEHGLDGIVY